MKYILGNWKQNGDGALLKKILALVDTPLRGLAHPTAKEQLKQNVGWAKEQHDSVATCLSKHVVRRKTCPPNTTIGIFPPFVYLSAAHELFEGTAIQLGAQNLSAEKNGAFTGEISAAMLKEVGCSMVLVGHSERRQIFHETDALIAQKFWQAEEAGLTPVLCVGETLAQFEAGETEAVIQAQLSKVLRATPNPFLIAYEPIWAIGTGKTAKPEQAEKVHAFIRKVLTGISPDFAQTPILYGGSVKADNAAELLAMPHIDGVLVGGASLNPEDFAKICES